MTIPELRKLNERSGSMDRAELQHALSAIISELTETLSAMEISTEAQGEMLRQFNELRETCKTQKNEIDRLNKLVRKLSGQLCLERNTLFGRKTEQAADITHDVLSGELALFPLGCG